MTKDRKTRQRLHVSRRQFLGTAAAASAMAGGYWVNPAPARASTSPNEKLNLGVVGVANKGWDNVQNLASENIAVMCDVDSNFLDRAAETYGQATRYRDYRKMLDKEANNLDGVVVSTADHTHAPITAAALDLGKHVYCEKPLTHTVEEARAIATLAKKRGVATQMGTQIHATENYRRVVEMVQAGMIGDVTAVHNWCNKGWSDGRFQETDEKPPENLNWELWLGPAADRAYSPNVHPANWRRFWEYGAGTFGDMACHIMDLPFWALDLRYPTSVECEGPELHPVGAPSWVKAVYEFDKVGGSELKEPLKFYWSDGGAHFDLVKETKDYSGQPLANWGLGVLFVGTKGMLAADYGRAQLLPKEKYEDVAMPEKSIPRSIGHWNEWVQACKTGEPTTCNFDYSGALTETVLLGIVAFRSQKALAWDSKELRATNHADAEQFVKKEYRKGFEVVGIS